MEANCKLYIYGKGRRLLVDGYIDNENGVHVLAPGGQGGPVLMSIDWPILSEFNITIYPG